jgi:uncharacterized protein (DUF1778 family)
MSASQGRDSKLDIRLTRAAKARLSAAAALRQQTVSQFVLESALGQADEALAERQHFGLDAARWAEFLQALDAPAGPMPRLARLMQEPSVFETDAGG